MKNCNIAILGATGAVGRETVSYTHLTLPTKQRV